MSFNNLIIGNMFQISSVNTYQCLVGANHVYDFGSALWEVF